MLKENEYITFTGENLIKALKEINLILISLHDMESYYGIKHDEGEIDSNSGEYERETTRFIDEWKVTHRLAKVRAILGLGFDTTLGEDDMDDLEREMEKLNYWTKPGDSCSDVAEFDLPAD